MGYYVETIGCDFVLHKENFEKAYEAMCELNDHDELKRGGQHPSKEKWEGRYNPNVWFSWLPYNYPETTSSVIDILELLGFENLQFNDDGDLIYLTYYSKIGGEENFFKSIAPFVLDNSYIDWRGEDGELWRWYFSNGEMLIKNGRVVFD